MWLGHRSPRTRPKTAVLIFAGLAVLATCANLLGARLAGGQDAAWLRTLSGAGLGYAIAAGVAPLLRARPGDAHGDVTSRLTIGASAAMGLPLAVALTPAGPWLETVTVPLGLLGPISVVVMWRALLGGLRPEIREPGRAWFAAIGLAAIQIGITLGFKGTSG